MTEKILLLSTAHLPTPNAIDEVPHRVASHQHGWIVFLSSAEHENTPEWWAKIEALAQAEGALYVNFDSCGDIADGLTVYDW